MVSQRCITPMSVAVSTDILKQPLIQLVIICNPFNNNHNNAKRDNIQHQCMGGSTRRL